MPSEIFFNGFTRVTLDGVSLGEMQIGNPRGAYPIPGGDRLRPEITLTVSGAPDRALFAALYDAAETGYRKREDRFYYRNCNVVNDLGWPDVFYRGRFPNSHLRIRVAAFEPLTLAVEATANYVRESRSRFMRIPRLDETVSNLLLIAAIARGYIPMHAAAIEIGDGDRARSILFMGLPNTGKTSTSSAVRRALGGRYLAEDVAFVRQDDRAAFGSPFTLDEQKVQDYGDLRADAYCGAPVDTIVMLRRSAGPAAAKRLGRGSAAIHDFVVAMNRYEFEWNQDLILRHLLIGGETHGWTSRAILDRYLEGMRAIAAAADAIEVTGEDARDWSRLVAEEVARK